jgi:SNF2 family DNA or RNA helicase
MSTCPLPVSQLRQLSDVQLTVDGFTGDLRPYQKIGAFYLASSDAVILADVCGSGKTRTTIAALGLLFNQRKAMNALVVTVLPSVDQWKDEIEQVTDWKVQIYRGPHRQSLLRKDFDVRVTTYDTMRRDAHILADFGHSVVIFDEATVLQNAWPAPRGPSQVHEAARLVSSSADRAWAITATPMQTSLMNTFAIYRTLGRDLYESPEDFIANHLRVIQIKIASRVVRQGRQTFNRDTFVPKVIGSKNVEEFKGMIENLYLRRELDELGQWMPEVTSIDVWLDMPSAQRMVYDTITEGILEMGTQGLRTVEGVQRLLYQLRCCDGLGSLQGETRHVSAKLDEAVRLIRDDLIPEQVVVFSRFIKPLEEMQERLRAEGITCGRYDGQVGEAVCNQSKKAFQNGDISVLLLSLKGEMALNLPQSPYLIALNQLFNPQRMTQLVGRLRRMNSKFSNIIVFNLLCRRSVEEGMLNVVRERAEQFVDVFGGQDILSPSDLLRSMTPEEVLSVIGYGRRT